MAFEPLLLAFSSSDGQVGVLNAVVFPKPPRPAQVPWVQPIERRALEQQAVCGDRLRLDRLVAQEALQQPQRPLGVPPALDHEV